MAEVYIRYSELENAITHSVKARKAVDDYVQQIRGVITVPAGRLQGSDDNGYVQSTIQLASEKMNLLVDKKQYFCKFENTAQRLLDTAKNVDAAVSDRISSIAESYTESRKWYEKAGDWIYNTFCVDMANHFSLIRDFVDCAKWFGDKVENITEKIHNWFKYGDGQYIWKIAKSIVGIGAAVVGVIAAIVSIPCTGGITLPFVIGCIGAAATTLGAVITTGNSISNIYTSGKALSLSGDPFDDDDGNPGAARYYGSSDKMSDAFNKFDYGDAETNARYRDAGKVIDTTKVIADGASFVCSIASLGNVKDYRITTRNDNINYRYNADKWYKGYSFSWDNIKRNFLHDMGYKITSGTLKERSMKIKLIDKGTVFKNSSLFGEKTINLFRTIRTTDNIVSFADNLDGLYDFATKSDKKLSDTVTAMTKLTGAFKKSDFWGQADKYITKGYKTVDSIVEWKTGEKLLERIRIDRYSGSGAW